MSLLHEIQASLMKEGSEIGPVLLKLRFLAARLGSALLEDWVRHEAEGYPADVPVPAYRVLPVSYTGFFSGPLGAEIRHAPLPPYLIQEHAGEDWVNFEMRQSISAVDELLSSSRSGSGSFEINCANLILLLSGKIYKSYACNSVRGIIGKSSLVEIQTAVRHKILELTISLEQQVPFAAQVKVGSPAAGSDRIEVTKVTNITNQTIYGNYQGSTSTGDAANVSVSISSGDAESIVAELVRQGLVEVDARAFAKVLENEKPESRDAPLGPEARDWLASNIGKSVNGIWKIGAGAAQAVLTEAALAYYGLK